jgi:tetratricopeptide (TPR) repeat protein
MSRSEAQDAFSRGQRLRESHRWKRAAGEFARATEFADDWAEAWFWLAVSCDNRGDETAAIPAYRRALALGLEDRLEARAWTWLASSLSKRDLPYAALAALEEAERLGGYEPADEYRQVVAATRRRVERVLRRR